VLVLVLVLLVLLLVVFLLKLHVLIHTQLVPMPVLCRLQGCGSRTRLQLLRQLRQRL
jgi:hypothetical protein